MDRGQITRKSYESKQIFFSSRRELSNPRRELSNPRRELKNISAGLLFLTGWPNKIK